MQRHTILMSCLLFLTLVHAQSPTPSVTPEPTTTPEPLVTTAPENVADTPQQTTDPKAEAPESEETSSFNFWHRIFSPVVGVALVAVVVIVIIIYWRRRRQNAFVEAVHDTQAFRDEI